MLKKCILIFFSIILLGQNSFSDRVEREFLLEELENTIFLYIETTEDARDMYIKIDQTDYIGTKEYKDKDYFQFAIPREVYNKFGSEDQFIENLYINESGKEVNILRTARENITKEKDSLNSINNQIVIDEIENLENNIPNENERLEKNENDKELEKYYEDNKGLNLKINPFFILGLILTILGIIINIRNRSE